MELFGGEPTAAAPASSPAVPTVKPAPDATRELRWVAGEVKELLRGGAAEPHEVAVVARSGREDTARAHRILEEAGVPATARIRTPLAEVPVLRALLEYFRAAARGWAYRPLRAVLAGPYLRPGVDLRSIDYIAGQKRPAGLGRWLEELRSLRADLEGGDAGGLRRRGLFPDRLESDLQALEAFARAAAELEGMREEPEWIRLTADLLAGKHFNLRRRLCAPAGDRWDVVRLDQRGLLALEALLREWEALPEGRTEPGGADGLDVAGWHARLRRLLEANEIALTTPAHKGVQVLEAHEMALSPFRHVFLIHANDGVFPRLPAGGGAFSDEERVRLAEAGIPLSHRAEALARERALWRAVTNGASVHVTYRTTDPAGTPLLPSLLVPDHDPADAVPRTREVPETPLDQGQLLRDAARRLAAARRAGAPRPVRVLAPSRLRTAVLAAAAEARRGGLKLDPAAAADCGTGAWNGLLRDPVVLERIRAEHGPDHAWSPTRLELYATCPFFFLLRYVLRLEEVGEAEAETSRLTFGSLGHRLLERFYGSFLAREEDPPASFDDRAEERYAAVAEAAFREAEEGEEWLGLPVLWRLRRAEIDEAVRTYLAWELELAAREGERPVRVELAFGRRAGGADGASAGEPVELRGEDLDGVPRRLLLTGRVDRLDAVGADGDARHRVLDYKTSTVGKRAGYGDGTALQGPLYMRAVAELLGVEVESARYRLIKGAPGNKLPVRWGEEDFRRALRIAFTIPELVRAGRFEAVHAASETWKEWNPGREVCRTEARHREGESRFDAPSPALAAAGEVAANEGAGEAAERAAGEADG